MEGYKHTELGWIPEDWEVKKVGDVCDFIVPGRNKPKDFNGDIPWITTPDINHNSTVFVSKQNLCISKEEAKSVGTKIVSKGSVIISCVGDLGLVAIAGNDLVINQQLHAFLPNDKINSNYLLYALTIQKRHMEKVATKTAVPYMNKENCNSIPILCPSISEQKGIARILLVWDKSIETLTQLIAEKQQLKKGLMQQLLTGKKRLLGFKGDWQQNEFGKVFEFIKSESYSREDLTNEGSGNDVLYIHYGDVHALYNGDHLDVESESRIPYLKSKIESKNGFTYLRDGDLIITDASEDYEGVGECTEVINIGAKKLIGGLHTIVARDKEGLTSILYRGYILKNPEVALTLKKLAVGISVYGISKSSLASLKIKLPSIEEQKAIADILAKSQTEIQMLQSQLEVFKQQKQGLMLQLLTGKKRVKV